ncbi:MAG: NADH:ubiquinone reductase (Na(+)-transporting) subunit C [Bacteroidales bacterium]|nr:NADH:ubiquinone reductase (Na(+)-transporting) subunit C [Bacteroidales bacterium]
MNTNSNTYTIVYTTILVVLVAAVLAVAATALKGRQTDNMNLEKMKTIMLSTGFGLDEQGAVDKTADFKNLYESHIGNTLVVNCKGETVEADAFSLNLKAEYANLKAGAEASLPVYECTMEDGRNVHILALYGAGLWGAIWGYIALEDDWQTVVGAIFDHASETPGLGAKIAEPAFYTQFAGKVMEKDGAFSPVAVIKGGATDRAKDVDAISGATITSRAVSDMLSVWLAAYLPYIEAQKAMAAVAEEPAETAEESVITEENAMEE